jgi:pilus assembly protein Flp/PilA
MKKLMRFFKEEDGATSVEYAVMVAFIAAVVMVGAAALGTATNDRLNTTATSITNGPGQ